MPKINANLQPKHNLQAVLSQILCINNQVLEMKNKVKHLEEQTKRIDEIERKQKEMEEKVSNIISYTDKPKVMKTIKQVNDLNKIVRRLR